MGALLGRAPHFLSSLTKSFTSVAVGLAITDGLLSLDDRVVDVLPEHVPADISEQGRRLTVHHLLSMTTGHAADTLEEAWRLEPDDLVKGFFRVPFAQAEGPVHRPSHEPSWSSESSPARGSDLRADR